MNKKVLMLLTSGFFTTLCISTAVVNVSHSENFIGRAAEGDPYQFSIHSPLYTGSSESGEGYSYVQTANGNNVKVKYNKLSPFEAEEGARYATGFNSIKTGSYIEIMKNGEIEGLAGITRVTVKCVGNSNTSMLRVHYGWEEGQMMNYIETIVSPFHNKDYTFDLPNGPSYVRIDSTYYSETYQRYSIGLNDIIFTYTCSTSENPYSVDNYDLNLVDDHYEVTRYRGSDTSLVVPSEYDGDGLPITAIADNFAVDIGMDKITSVVLPSSITRLGSSAFSGASKLETINLEHVTNIGYQTFFNCSKLGSKGAVELYANVIGEDAFVQSGLTELYLYSHRGTVDIGREAFVNCHSLTNVVFDGDITLSYRISIFHNCDALESITLPITLNYIDPNSTFEPNTLNRNTFTKCTSLSTVNYSGTVAQWNSIDKSGVNGHYWYEYIPATVVHCTDGDVNIR